MFSATELVQALQRRMQLVDIHLRRPAGEFPPGWQGWFASMPARVGAVTGATAPAFVHQFLQRPLAGPPRRSVLLNRWQAFATLWRQQWHPAGPDDRGARWFAGAVSALWHLFFGALLLWLMVLQYLAVSPPPLGEEVVQVEFIGHGTPAEVGAAPATPETADAAQVALQPTAAPAPVPTTAPPSLVAPLPDVAQRDISEPQLPAPTAQQPVAVSEPTPSQTEVFALPPATPRITDAPAMAPELVAPIRPVQAMEVPEPAQPINRALPSRTLVARPIAARVPEVATRDVPTPLRLPTAPVMPPLEIAMPRLPATVPLVRAVELPTPVQAATATAAASPQAPTRPALSADRSAASAANAAAPASTSAAATTKSVAPAATAGAAPTRTRADDWGDAARNRPGAQRGVPGGVYNADGSVRVAQTPGSASPGLPPGTVDDRITNLDRAGTWLKRKPNDYEPSPLDQYWRPNETLLAEWVRKSITTVRIPIPGTNKHVVCQTVLLALGGGCTVTDPNLNEQPATARPPPDIPFKPELQEDNGSVKP